MTTTSDHAHWRGVLSGGTGSLPRWVRAADGVAGVHVLAVPDDLAAALPGVAAACGVPAEAVVLAVHARVLAALTGEDEILTAIVTGPGATPRPVRLDSAAASWRVLMAEAADAAAAARAHDVAALAALHRDPDVARPETLLDPRGADPDLPPGAALAITGLATGTLRLRHRPDALDGDAAARIAGYHLAALRALVADPDAPPDRDGLVGPEELRFQLDGLAGPRVARPDRRAHDLVRDRARTHPDAVALVRGERRWTYGELDDRVTRIARALLTRGLQREDVVAVVTERTLGWAAAVLGVMAAGGAYLPIEPQFPADRIATVLRRSGCRLVLTEQGCTATLDAALRDLEGVERLHVEDAVAGDPARTLPIVTGDQLAYLYFTSGSTGEPKGAMCEHAGMLNHLLAKIEDLGVDEGTVVAQTAPQCFDISLWQLVAALLVGGTTLLVEQEVVLDVPRFVDVVARGRVGVLQIVPSYLDVVVSYLEEHPVDLPDLRCVAVTGEALKKELAARWFAVRPDIPLVNAYGLTETSDDTNHEVMQEVPVHERVPLGRVVANVEVRVVDEHLAPVPLGAPGEIVFSGVCVGRGYVNDPERTARAFVPDPLRPGERLYRSGDRGRWLPDGRLDFLGRRDHQVKISGIRIEIGEVENALLRAPGVRDAAVVVSGAPGRGKQLVGFYGGPRPIATEVLRATLGESLPASMVPSVLHHRDALPLTANGKVDRNALTALAGELDAAVTDRDAPRTPTEHRLAAVWATLLDVDPSALGRDDHFFDRGGSSLLAVKMAVRLDKEVSLSDITRHPVLADLAALMDGRAAPAPPTPPAQPPAPLAGLLQSLSDPGEPTGGALVGIPHAGGHAVNFRPLAAALRGSGLVVHAVELPGHDPTAPDEPFAPLAEVADRVAAEIVDRALPDVVLWGHSAGAAVALAVARRLEERGVPPRRVVIAAQLPGTPADRRRDAAELTARTDTDIAARLSADAGADLEPRRVARAAAAYRHDCLAAHGYLVAALENPPPRRLATPVTVVVAADDPSTTEFPERHGDWELLVEDVDLEVLDEGGHHFLRTRPAAAARVVLHAADLVGTP